jgi:hypothetical protein
VCLSRYLPVIQTLASENIHWCRFIPSYQSLIGSRSQKTLNIITTSIKPCYSSADVREQEKKCSFFNIVFGRIRGGRTADSVCMVNADKMYTIILAMQREHEMIQYKVELFRKTLGTVWSAYYSFLFISTEKSVPEALCGYAFKADTIYLMCLNSLRLVDGFTTITKNSAKVWTTSIGVHFSPSINLDTVTQREFFTQNPVNFFLMTETLKFANESAGYQYYDSPEMRISSQYETIISSTVHVDDLTTRFISCFEKPTLKFQMYVKPFDIEVWVSLTLCCFLIAGLIHIYNRIFHFSGSFSPIFFFVSTLVEEPYSVPSALWNSRILKIVTLAWLLTAIVFTNLYIGLMISDVTAPVRGEIFDTFDKVLGLTKDQTIPSLKMFYQLRAFWKTNYTNTRLNRTTLHVFTEGCEDIFGKYRFILHQYDSSGYEIHLAQFRSSESFAILQNQIEKCEGNEFISNNVRSRFLSQPLMYGIFYRLFNGLIRLHFQLINHDVRYLRRLYAFFSPKHRHYPKNPYFPQTELDQIPIFLSAAIEKELVACERSIFIGERKDLNMELSYLKTNYPRKHFYISNDTFESGWSTPIIWTFKDSKNSKVPLYFKLLLEAGVRDVLLGLRKHNYYLKRRVGTKFVQAEMLKVTIIGMSGSIQTIFIITFACLSIATMVFMMEFAYRNRVLFNNTVMNTLDTMRICIFQFSTLKFTVQLKR